MNLQRVLENEVMREYINHLRAPELIEGIFSSRIFGFRQIDHGDSCRECSRLTSTFFPDRPWRGWAA